MPRDPSPHLRVSTMRFSFTSILFSLVALSSKLAASLEVENCGGGGALVTPSCYTCPRIAQFNAGLFSSEKTNRVCFGYLPGAKDDRMACTYYEKGYFYTEKYFNGNTKERYQTPRLIGRCYYTEDGDLKGGSYSGYSSQECPSKAPREVESECAQERDKGTYFKKCAAPDCAYETETCYGCPRLNTNTNYVDVDTRNGGLKCSYSTTLVIGSYNNTCTYDPKDGKLINTTNLEPPCQLAAPQVFACDRVRQQRIVEGKRAQFIKENYTNKGLTAKPCIQFLTERWSENGSVAPLFSIWELEEVCNFPEYYVTIKKGDPLANEDFIKDLENLQETPGYGYYHVTG
ncbi:hypothetical protein D9615_002578 [Tricholomella constricta]|uniref:Uncharacterized protein n=1 Tax=Tricholomella constricta TaxID=117010 RepID=A0A8H5HM16_9AGAR|nr:hypothetical protein D9615_002578 [Tricholomella constricta]